MRWEFRYIQDGGVGVVKRDRAHLERGRGLRIWVIRGVFILLETSGLGHNAVWRSDERVECRRREFNIVVAREVC